MAQQGAASRIVAGAVTIVGLAAVWIAIVTSLPSQEELSARVAGSSALIGAGSSAPATGKVPGAQPTAPEPVLDLSIPGVAPALQPNVPEKPSPEQLDRRDDGAAGPAALNPRAAQVLRLKCEAEIEQLCPDALDGSARGRCVERRAKELPPACQNHLRERFVKWKEDRGRMLAACREDVRRLCPTLRPGDGRLMQCLQEHAQDVSDRCYETLPKGTLLFQQ
ncbi:MAG TPA: cysteine rich repeat-containing protein [Nitrospira sp.]|nr:cysteine rich repeat-containing protein [Nitrospira sp.]